MMAILFRLFAFLLAVTVFFVTPGTAVQTTAASDVRTTATDDELMSVMRPFFIANKKHISFGALSKKFKIGKGR